MRHRHFLLLGLGLATLWLSWNGISEAQQRPNARILKFPTEATHSKFYVTVMGEVGHPGVYEFDHPNVTLPELIEQAGGLKELSASRNIYSFRNGRPGPQSFYTQDSMFVVMPGDILAAGRKPDYAAGRVSQQGGPVQSAQVEPPQVVVVGITDRPVLLNLPLNAASIPGLFALLNQDRNPARSVAVYPPNGPAFAYTAQNNQPVPLMSGTIVLFDPQTVMRDGLPPLPPVANARTNESAVEQTSQVTRSNGPKVLISSDSASLQTQNSFSQDSISQHPTPQSENGGTADPGVRQEESHLGDSRPNGAAPKFHLTSRSQALPVASGQVANTMSRQEVSSSSGTDPTGLKFPGPNEVQSTRTSETQESALSETGPSLPDPEQPLAKDDLPLEEASFQKAESGRASDSIVGTGLKGETGRAQTAAPFPIWMVMAMTGIGAFCVAGMVMLLRDMQQFKKIVIETRNSHSILDQLVRGELPLHEETVEMTHGRHFTGSPNPPLKRYRADEPHQSNGEERWVPQPHVSFEDRPATVADRAEASIRIDREDERVPQSRSGRSVSGTETRSGTGTRPSTAVPSSTVLDRILSTVNGERNARRA